MTAVQLPPTSTDPIQERLDRITAQLDALSAEAAAQREQREVLGELLGDAAPVSRELLDGLTVRLAALDARGYREFARSSAGVVDRVVTSFGAEDVEALGDNIVLILSTIREMTQPEVMTMLRRTASTVNAPEPVGTPSLPALLRQLRTPAVRRGLARLIALLATLGEPNNTNKEMAR
jgi:uncharacterized protein YjgD (DUF1641 family)